MEPTDRRYTKEHEWIRPEGDEAVVGITDYAQNQLGDVVFVELPATGRRLDKGEAFGVVESVKSVADLYAPVAGTVVAVNEALVAAPEEVNHSPYDEGWMIRIKVDDQGQVDALMDSVAYDAHLAAEGGA
jgi:glycine cleavage system H protein